MSHDAGKVELGVIGWCSGKRIVSDLLPKLEA